jgi:hypothetical protein
MSRLILYFQIFKSFNFQIDLSSQPGTIFIQFEDLKMSRIILYFQIFKSFNFQIF